MKPYYKRKKKKITQVRKYNYEHIKFFKITHSTQVIGNGGGGYIPYQQTKYTYNEMVTIV